MIIIKKDPNADSRSAKGKPNIKQLEIATADHIDHVQQGLSFFSNLLTRAGLKHDETKTSNMDDFHKALTSGEIKKSKWYKNHITKERHHLIAKVPTDVNLIDVLEHLVDCVMAGSARSGQIFDVELSNEVLQLAHKNTIELLKKQIKVEENK